MDPQKGRGTALIALGGRFAGRASMRGRFWPQNRPEPAYSPEFLRGLLELLLAYRWATTLPH